MDYERTYKGLREYVRRRPQETKVYEDGYTLLKRWVEVEAKEGLKKVSEFRAEVASEMQRRAKEGDYDKAEKYRQLIFELYKIEAPYKFDSFCLALEYDRPVEEQFYYPRREILRPYVEDLQRLEDGEITELFLSCPPRVGKTTLVMFYLLWLMGKYPEKSNLYSSYSDTITLAFYRGLIEVLSDRDTYKWHEIFEGKEIPENGTDSKNETINICRIKKYATVTCRSLYGTLNGACDCDGLLIADDLLSGIEEALNKDRLAKAWQIVSNNLLSRAKQKAKVLWIGTRWSIYDPIGVRISMVTEDKNFRNKRYKIINVPALNEEDESNWNYKYGVGFSTEMYKQIRAGFERTGDMASFNAQYMGNPIEREGSLFEPTEMRYYNGELPMEEPDRIFAPVDPAFGGGDYVSCPMCVQYGEDIYVPAVVFNNGDKTVTQPAIARLCARYKPTVLKVEANLSTKSYAEGVETELKRAGVYTTVITAPANNQKRKEQGIFDRAPDIRTKFIFLQSGERDREYEMFMQNVFAFKFTGKNKHDDAPDSLKMAAEMAFTEASPRVRIRRRII